MVKFLFFFLLWALHLSAAQIEVVVSILPQKYLVERIGADHVHIEVMVPAGANSHAYEPTMKQILAAQKGVVWFRIGESFEQRMIPMMGNIRMVDQREGIHLIEAGCGCCNHDAHDPHIWLSPRSLKVQSEQITRVLCEIDPVYQDFFKNNLIQLLEECHRLDLDCATLFLHAKQKKVLVSHPAFGYLCRDYGLEQLSIEMEGREPTPRYINALIEEAHAANIKTVFLQQQHNPKGGKRIAKELGAKTIFIDPYAEDVLANIRHIAEQFSQT